MSKGVNVSIVKRVNGSENEDLGLSVLPRIPREGELLSYEDEVYRIQHIINKEDVVKLIVS